MNKYFLLFIMITPLSCMSGDIIIQSTTSTRDSGLYEYLLPNYPDYENVGESISCLMTLLLLDQ